MMDHSQPQSQGGLPRPLLERTRRGTLALLVGSCLVRLVWLHGAPLGTPVIDLIIAGIGLALVACIQEVRLPVQNWLAAMVVVGLMGAAVEGLILNTPHLSWLALMWIVCLLTARGVARRVLRPWANGPVYGFWLIGFAGILSGLFVSLLQATSEPGTAFPWGLSIVRIAAALAMLIAIAPLLVSKMPTAATVDWESTACWLALNTPPMGTAAFQHDWTALGLALITAGAPCLFFVRQQSTGTQGA